MVSRDILPIELSTKVRLSETSPNFPPIVRIGDVISEPGRESAEAVLAESTALDRVRAVGTSDDEGEDEDDEEGPDENRHTDEVEGEEAFFVPVGAYEAGEGD
ncbi:unnamed protein product [Camellia sinensis]